MLPDALASDDERLARFQREAEVATSSSDGPEEILIFAGACGHESSGREHDIRRAQVVERQSMFPHQPSETAAECETTNTGDRDKSSGGSETVWRNRARKPEITEDEIIAAPFRRTNHPREGPRP